MDREEGPKQEDQWEAPSSTDFQGGDFTERSETLICVCYLTRGDLRSKGYGEKKREREGNLGPGERRKVRIFKLVFSIYESPCRLPAGKARNKWMETHIFDVLLLTNEFRLRTRV